MTLLANTPRSIRRLLPGEETFFTAPQNMPNRRVLASILAQEFSRTSLCFPTYLAVVTAPRLLPVSV